MPKHIVSPREFEPEFIASSPPSSKKRSSSISVLGLKITSIRPERATGRIDMRRELVGHFVHNRIHGGVISAGLDAMAGLAVMAALGARHMDEPVAQRLARFSRVGTIDLRVDYLRPGISEHFELRAEVMRIGRGLPPPAWSSSAPTAPCSPLGRPPTSCLDGGPRPLREGPPANRATGGDRARLRRQALHAAQLLNCIIARPTIRPAPARSGIRASASSSGSLVAPSRSRGPAAGAAAPGRRGGAPAACAGGSRALRESGRTRNESTGRRGLREPAIHFRAASDRSILILVR